LLMSSISIALVALVDEGDLSAFSLVIGL
jgi:hypothetical protein